MRRFLTSLLLAPALFYFLLPERLAAVGALVGSNTMEAQTTTLTPYTIIGVNNLLVVGAVALSTDTLTVTSDTKGNSWTCSSTAQGNFWGVAFCFARTNATGADTITVNTSGGSGAAWQIAEFSGLIAGAADNGNFNSSAGATSMTSGAFTPTSTALVMACAGTLQATSLTPGAGYTSISSFIFSGAAYFGCEYKVASTGAQNAAYTAGISASYGMGALSFREAYLGSRRGVGF